MNLSNEIYTEKYATILVTSALLRDFLLGPGHEILVLIRICANASNKRPCWHIQQT